MEQKAKNLLYVAITRAKRHLRLIYTGDSQKVLETLHYVLDPVVSKWKGGRMTIEEVLAFDEMQIFDRKSIHIEPKSLAITVVAFANADGGTVAIGISDKTKRIEGTDYDTRQLNELLTVPYDFCEPTV